MKRNLTFIALIIAAAFLVGGCATGSRVETDYGTSYKLAKFGQTLNPDAENNAAPVTGLGGPAAQRSYDQYLKSFEKPEKQSVFQLGIIGQGSK